MAVEDFTGYTEVDPDTTITVTATKIAVDECSDDTYVYDDKGADHFGASWDHDYEHTSRDISSGDKQGAVAVSNTVDDAAAWLSNNNEAVGAYFRRYYDVGYKNRYFICDYEDGDTDGSSYECDATGTKYYLTFKRTSETNVSLEIYSDSGRTSLEDTVSVTITSGRRYRYIFGIEHSAAGSVTVDFDVENLDLQEAAGGISIPVVMRTYRNRRVA